MSGLRATVLGDSPWAFWPMGITSPYSDLTGNGRPLTAGSGSPGQVTSIVPGDNDLDAGSLHSTGAEYLTLPFPGSPTTFSFEVWVQTSGACTIWGSFPNCYAGIDGSGDMFFTIVAGATYTTAASLSDGNLHHLVWTFSVGTLAMYIDGVAGSTGVAPASLATGSLFGYGSTPWLDGTLGDVASYDTTLTGVQVAAHYAAGSVGPLHLTASDSMSAITETPNRLMALIRAFGNTMSAITDAAIVTAPSFLTRTTIDTMPVIGDTAFATVVGVTEAQFHPEVVFKVFDLYTKEYFGTLPLDSARFGLRYNAIAGTFQATLSPEPPPAAPIRPEAIRLRRMLVVEINEWPLWVGLLDALNWDSETSMYQVRATELWNFYDAWPLSSNLTYFDIEQITILADLIAWVTSQAGGDIGLTTSFPVSDIHRNLNIIGSANSLLGNIVRAHGISIFDGYQVRGPRVIYDDNLQIPRLLMEANSPTLGRRYDLANSPRFRFLPTGGEVLKVTFDDNAATAAGYATMVVGTSVLTGNPTPVPLHAVAVNSVLRAANWPESIYVLPAVQDYDQSTLQARVDAELFRRASVYGAPSVTITLVALWQARLLPGDDAIFIFHDDLRWPTKKMYVYRVTGIDVDIEAETATLVLDPSSVGELVDEVLTQMPGTTNQNPSNGPAYNPTPIYYPPFGPGGPLPSNLPPGGVGGGGGFQLYRTGITQSGDGFTPTPVTLATLHVGVGGGVGRVGMFGVWRSAADLGEGNISLSPGGSTRTAATFPASGLVAGDYPFACEFPICDPYGSGSLPPGDYTIDLRITGAVGNQVLNSSLVIYGNGFTVS